jgi:ubiquinone/menaquinone biosynthesis C-methylase UbiE
MSDALESAKQKAESTYNSAADHFDGEPLAFWDRYGTRTVERLRLRAGARVLDVCCGTGASALPAARAVSQGGSVLGVDLAERLLKIARAKANAARLTNIELRRGDMTALGFPDASFDAVVCVFGIFFVPDMERQVAELSRMLRPGGTLAITTRGPRWLAPGYETWRASVKRVRPDLHAAFNPWDRITTTDAVKQLFADAGIARVDVEPESGWQPLRSPRDFWSMVLGTGMRWTMDRMSVGESLEVEREVLEHLAAQHVERVETNVIYAAATKPTRRV